MHNNLIFFSLFHPESSAWVETWNSIFSCSPLTYTHTSKAQKQDSAKDHGLHKRGRKKASWNRILQITYLFPFASFFWESWNWQYYRDTTKQKLQISLSHIKQKSILNLGPQMQTHFIFSISCKFSSITGSSGGVDESINTNHQSGLRPEFHKGWSSPWLPEHQDCSMAIALLFLLEMKSMKESYSL